MSSKPDNSRGRRRAPSSVAALIVRGLACRRGERILFRDFDLDLAHGELVWLRAANGFGKTSLLRVLAGLAKPEAGTVEWTRPDAEHTSPLLYLAHANALKDELTVLESLRYLDALHGLGASEEAMADALRRFGLHAKRNAPVRTLSQGQRRRVALARLCLSPARASWILDEPCDALDAGGIAVVSTLLAAHAAGGGAVLFTSHMVVDGLVPRTVQLDAA